MLGEQAGAVLQTPSARDPEVLHRRAEELLDEMMLGSVDAAAAGSQPNAGAYSRGGGSFKQEAAALRAEVAALLRKKVVFSQVSPDNRLRPIRHVDHTNGERALPATADAAGRTEAAPALSAAPAPALRPARPDVEPALPPESGVPERAEAAAPRGGKRAVPAIAVPDMPLELSEAHELQDEIARLYEEVNQVLATRREVTGHALSLLREARTIVYTQPDRLYRARHNVRQVHTILERAKQNRQSSSAHGLRLFGYLLFWFLFCTAGIVLVLWYRDVIQGLGAPDSTWSLHSLPFLLTVFAGGIGGALGATAALVGQIRERRGFDRQYSIRYLIQPIMGVVLGIFVYLATNLFYNALAVDFVRSIWLRFTPVLLGLLVGLWQELVYSLLYRVVALLSLRPRRRA